MQPSVLNFTENPAYLFVSRPGEQPQVAALEENNSLFVGSGTNCRVVLQGSGIEPIHCMFWMNEERMVRVQDWNTDIGITINGQPVSVESILNSGDELEIGENRIVTVLTPDVHQRFLSQLANIPEFSQQMNLEASEPEPLGVDLGLAEQCEMPIEEVATQPVSFSQEIESETESHKSAESRTSMFEYDVMAELDCVDLDDSESTNEFGIEGMELGECSEFNESRNEEIELLRTEIDQLRFELAERDAQLDTVREPNLGPEPARDEDDQTIQLVNRLEELLEELKASDDRVRGLEDLLRASDQATQAERDERRQLESWVTEIEQRVAERESESEAELSRLRSQLDETTARHKRTQVQLKKVLQSKNVASGEATNDLIPTFRAQVEELENRLEAATKEIDQLRRQALCDEKETESRDELHEMEQKLLQQEVETARERAEMSRQRAELEQLKGELGEKLSSAKDTGNGDARLRAMRQHLREIHEEEKTEREERRQRSLGGRISRLLGSSRS